MTTILSFLVAVGVLIFVHEWGHYRAARSVGVRCERFSIGFGRVLLERRDAQGCRWTLAAIPLGGFVQMNEDHPTEGFLGKPLWARAWVVAAGPLMNLVFAIAALTVLYSGSQQVPAPILAAPALGSPAEVSGLRAGDTIRSIAGRPVDGFQDVQWALTRSGIAGRSDIPITVQRQGAEQSLVLALPASLGSSESLSASVLGLAPAAQGVVLGEIRPGSAAERAGLKPGDLVVRADGQALGGADDLIARVRAKPNAAMLLEGEAGQRWSVTLGSAPEGHGQLGAGVSSKVAMVEIDRSLLSGLWAGVQRTVELSVLSLQAMGAMIEGRLHWTELSGPATIATAAGESAKRGGESFLAFMALISVSIAVLNLLPVPMLDGGHLLYYSIEWIRGKPLSMQAQQLGQKIGLGLIVMLTGLALTSDALRLLGT